MYDILLTYISQRAVTPITAEQEVLIRDAFQPKKLRKKQYLLQEGDVCKYLSFIAQGTDQEFIDSRAAIKKRWLSAYGYQPAR